MPTRRVRFNLPVDDVRRHRYRAAWAPEIPDTTPWDIQDLYHSPTLQALLIISIPVVVVFVLRSLAA